MNLIAWVFLGILAGTIAKSIYPGYQGGDILSTTLLGIVGAFVGGTMVNLLQTGSFALTSVTLSLPSVFVSVFCATIAIVLYYQLVRKVS